MGLRPGILWQQIIKVPLHFRRCGWQEPFGRLFAQSGFHCGCFDTAIEKLDPGFAPVVNAIRTCGTYRDQSNMAVQRSQIRGC
jgi:hypothetical protein